MSTELLAHLDDLEQAFLDALREVRAVLQAAVVRELVVEARLDECRSLLQDGVALRTGRSPVASPTIGATPADVEATVPLAPVRRLSRRISKICACGAFFDGSPKRRFCDSCFRAQASARLRATHARQRAARTKDEADGVLS